MQYGFMVDLYKDVKRIVDTNDIDVSGGNVLDEELAIGDYEPQISIQIWKRAMDNARIELIAPTGERLVISERNAGVVHHNIKNMRIVSKAYGPGPFYCDKRIYYFWNMGYKIYRSKCVGWIL